MEEIHCLLINICLLPVTVSHKLFRPLKNAKRKYEKKKCYLKLDDKNILQQDHVERECKTRRWGKCGFMIGERVPSPNQLIPTVCTLPRGAIRLLIICYINSNTTDALVLSVDSTP